MSDAPEAESPAQIPAEPQGEDQGLSKMSFLEHLEELRRRLLISLVTVVVASIGAWFISEQAIDFVARPVGHLNFSGITEAFNTRIKMSIALGFIFSLPVVFYHTWRFTAPGLFRHERRYLLPVLLSSIVLFLLGVGFALKVIVPVAVKFMLGFATEGLTPVIMIGQYLGFVMKMCIAFGVVFQMPLVVSALTHLGVVSSDTLKRQWRYALVGIFGMAAVLTPPDVLSQALMGLPLVTLYFVSVLLSIRIEKRRERREREEMEESPGS